MYILIGLVFSIFFSFQLLKNGNFASNDGGLYMINDKISINTYFSYTHGLGLGEGISHHGNHLILSLFRYIFGENIELYQFIFYLLLFFSIFIGFKLIIDNLSQILFKSKLEENKIFIYVLISLFYIFNPINVTYRLITTNSNTYFFYILPLLLGFFLLYLNKQSIKTSIYLILIVFFTSFVSWVIPQYIGLIIFVVIFILLLKLLLNYKINYKLLLFTIFCLILTNIYWIINFILLGSDNLNTGISLVDPIGNINYLSSYFKIYHLFGFYVTQHRGVIDLGGGYFKNIIVVGSFILFIFYTFYIFLFKKYIDNKIKIIFITLLLIFIELSNPSGIFAYFLKENITNYPILSLYRTAHEKISYFLIIILLFIIFYILFLNNDKYYKYLSLYIILLFSIPFISGKIFFDQNGNLISHFNLPKSYFTDFKDLEKLGNGTNRILLLPLYSADRVSTNYGYIGLDPYVPFLGTPFLGNFTNNFLITKNFVDDIYNDDKNSFNQKLNLFGVKYIVIRKDEGLSKNIDLNGLNHRGEKPNLQYKILLDNNNILYYKNINGFDIYLNKSFNRPIISINNNYKFKNNNPIKYTININSLGNKQELLVLMKLSKYWKLYLKQNQNASWCKPLEKYNNDGKNITECEHKQEFFEGEELSYLYKKPLFENTHQLIYDYANGWTISKDEIIKYVEENYSKELKKEGYPKTLDNGKKDYKYYTLNPDGSIDVELTLYFKPQSYFYIGLAISGTTFVLLIGYLGVDIVRNRRRKVIEILEKNQTV